MFSDAGPDIRWVGNETGIAGDPCWATLEPRTDFAPGEADAASLNRGDRPGTHWLPAECDVSIRPGWFYHAAEDAKVQDAARTCSTSTTSRSAAARRLLLNLPPDRRGRIHENDVALAARVPAACSTPPSRPTWRAARRPPPATRGGGDAQFAAANVLDGNRDTYWTTDDAVTTPELVLDLGRPVTFNVVSLREHLPLGQRVEGWALDAVARTARGASSRKGRASATAGSGAARTVTTTRVRLRITKAPVCPAISELALHLEPPEARAR